MGRTPAGETRQKIFEFVRERLLSGRPPTVREVQEAFGFRAVQTARQHLESLVAEGKLLAQRGKSRGYRLPGNPAEQPTVSVPLLGRVPAGSLDTAVEELEGYIPVQTQQAAGELFALRVHGESMTGAGILPGDVVVVRRQPTAQTGDIVVALVGDEATVKTLRLGRQRVELHPANPDFEPILLQPEEVTILGRVIELRRTFK
jgi:repressor LexA